MNRYFITHIGASGEGVRYSSVEFKDGVNIIHGASNSGKSYLINCINFMFAGEIPFTRNSTGYDTISMQMQSTDGYTVSMERKIVDGKSGDIGANSIRVTSTDPCIPEGEYSISQFEYSDLLLRLMGIKEHHSIIAKRNYKLNNLTIRTIFHFFFLDEDNIFEKPSALDTPRHSNVTSMLSSLKFLFDGDDLSGILPDESPEEREERIVGRNAILTYIGEKITELQDQKERLQKQIDEHEDPDLDDKIDALVSEIENVEAQIQSVGEQSRRVLAEIYDVGARLEEATFLKERYKVLHTQYSSDIKRLRFIIEGDHLRKGRKHLLMCPFCEQEMKPELSETASYRKSAEAELQRIQVQLDDLKTVEKEVSCRIHDLNEEMDALRTQNSDLVGVINSQLQPRAAKLKAQLSDYRQIVRLKQELCAIESISTNLNTDAFNKENEEDTLKLIFDPKSQLDADKWKAWSDRLQIMVQECEYPGRPAARLSMDAPYDAIVGGKSKKNEGKGYRAFLNTIVLFSLMKTLETDGTYRSGILILDSPILSLKEKHNVSEAERATPGMRASLFDYMIRNCGDNQVIIVENEIPANVDYSTANLLEFTLEEGNGRFGFLRDLHDTSNL